MFEKLGKITNEYKKFKMGVLSAAKFFSSQLGIAILYIIGGVILAILVWLIVLVIANNVASLIGVDLSPIETATNDTEFLQALANSGYDAMLDASELSRYYNFEYNVLMDAARFLEETGTTEMMKEDSGNYDYRSIDRDTWAKLAANQFAFTNFIEVPKNGGAVTGWYDKILQQIKDKANKMVKTVQAALQTGAAYEKNGAYYDKDGNIIWGASLDEMDPTKAFSTERSDKDLYYQEEFNEYTNKRYLAPYLRINRSDDILTYFFEITNFGEDPSIANLSDQSIVEGGGKKTLSSADNNLPIAYSIDGKSFQGDAFAGPLNRHDPSKFNQNDLMTAEMSYKFIKAHVFPIAFDSEINQNNKAALDYGDARRNPLDSGAVDLNAKHGANIDSSIYFTQQSEPTEYHVPLRVLLDRFLPNASLLASWRHLESSETEKSIGIDTSSEVVNEIMKMYNQACLDNEIVDASKLLVKSVAKAGNALKSDLSALDLITGSSAKPSEQAVQERYNILGSGATTRIYTYYAGLFDTVSGDRSKHVISGQDNDPPLKYKAAKIDVSTATPINSGGNAGSVSTPDYVQTFPEDFVGDIKDDFRLALTHFSYDYNISKADMQMYEDAIKDIFEKQADKLLRDKSGREFSVGNTFMGQEAIAYRKVSGKYVVICNEVLNNNINGIKAHYDLPGSSVPEIKQVSPSIVEENGRTVAHDKSSRDEVYSDTNPYTLINAKGERCFIPLIRACVSVDKNGLKTTAIIICDKEGKSQYAYFVNGKEIDDVANITHNHTFARFEATDLVSTTFKHWNSANNPGELSKELWIVQDAFEGLGFDKNSVYNSVSLLYTIEHFHEAEVDEEGKIIDDEYYTYENKSITLDENILVSLGLTEEKIAELILPSVELKAKLAVEEHKSSDVLWKGPFGVIRTPDWNGYKVGTVNGLGRSQLNYRQLQIQDKVEGGVFNDSYKDLPAGTCPLDAMLAEGQFGGYHGLREGDWGEAVVPSKTYINLKKLEITTDTDIPGLTGKIADPVKEFLESIDKSALLSIIPDKNAKLGNSPVRSSKYKQNNLGTGISVDPELDVMLQFGAVFPVKISVGMISQQVETKQMNAYFVKDTKYWAATKDFYNAELIIGEFLQSDWNNYKYLIPNNGDARGITDIKSIYKKLSWRGKYFAPIFGAKIDNDSVARENDIRLILSEWEEASNQNVHAADHYIRDLYSLIKYSQGISGDEVIPAVEETSGVHKGEPYINPNSYQFFYIADEILQFDPLTCEKIFWMDRIICTRNDAIDENLENVMRSKLPIFTWQKVDYNEYPETLLNVDASGEETHGAYGLWLFGGQAARSVYAFSANATEKQNSAILRWGSYSAAHKANDLYGRTLTGQVYDSVMTGGQKNDGEKEVFNLNYGYGYYPKTGNSSVIKAGFDNHGDVILYYSPNGKFISAGRQNVSKAPTNTNSLSLSGVMDEGDFVDGDYSGGGGISAGNESLTSGEVASVIVTEEEIGEVAEQVFFYNGTPVQLKLGNTLYNFQDPFSAVYGYLVYRETLALGDPEKAEQVVKKQLEKEIVWQEVRAIAPGYVDKIGGDAVNGFFVRIQHTIPESNGDVSTAYCHMKRYPIVQVGEYVGAGTVIGYEGTTGKSGGFHCHINLKMNNFKTNPNRFMYPFFAPFWYEEKAEENKDDISSEYYSLDRTVFAYQQKDGTGNVLAKYNDDDEERFKRNLNYSDYATVGKEAVSAPVKVSAHRDNDGNIVIKNYVPQYPMVYDANDLITTCADGYGDFITKNVDTNADKVDYEEELMAIPDYADPDFIALVYENEQKIKGLPLGLSRHGSTLGTANGSGTGSNSSSGATNTSNGSQSAGNNFVH